MRIYEFAKELGISNKELIAKLREMGHEAKSHMSSLDAETAQILRGDLRPAAAAEEGVPPVKEGAPPAEKAKTVAVRFPITVKELSEKLGAKPNEVIKKLISMGVFASLNQSLDKDTAEILAHEYGYDLRHEKREAPPKERAKDEEKAPEEEEGLEPRAPIVTLMGHVDHGKTTILDTIRRTKVASGEAGGITQHIGAYMVEYGGKPITFLDTPGHEAFTSMRARGADVTDIAVLVIAAEEGVMPQTVEAIDHARAAKVPILIAVNKIDKPGANPERVRTQLAEKNLSPEEWGGETIFCELSGLTGEGIDHFLEMLQLQAEILELKANPAGPAEGVVIEAELSAGRGPTVTVVVKKGMLRVGDPILCGLHSGRVKALYDDQGRRVKDAGPSTPVEVVGLSGVPYAGSLLKVFASEREARDASKERMDEDRENTLGDVRRVTLEDIYRQIEIGGLKELNLVVKGDVQGSVEALCKELKALGREDVRVKIIHFGVGEVSESDVMLALASGGLVIGFHVKASGRARDVAKREGVEIRLYDVIYTAVEEIHKALEGLLEPEVREVVIGHAEVRQIFKISRLGAVAGCHVRDGMVTRSSRARLLRGEDVIFEGAIRSLRRFKEEAREVKSGLECGIRLAGWDDIQEGDIIEALTYEEVKQILS